MRRKIFALPDEIVAKLAAEAETWAGGDDRGREADIVRDALARRYSLISGDHFPLTEYEKDLVIGARLLVQRDAATAHSLAFIVHAATRHSEAREATRAFSALLRALYSNGRQFEATGLDTARPGAGSPAQPPPRHSRRRSRAEG